jgi:hypothetical protein
VTIAVELHLLGCPACSHGEHEPGDCPALIAPATLCDCQESPVPESRTRYAVNLRAIVDEPAQARDLVRLWTANALPTTAGLPVPSVSLSVDEYVEEEEVLDAQVGEVEVVPGVLVLPDGVELPESALDALLAAGVEVRSVGDVTCAGGC